MRPAHIASGEDAEEGDILVGGNLGEGALDVEAAALLAIDQAEDADDGHAGVAHGLDGGDGGAAGGAYVVDDDDMRAGLQEAFDAAARAVCLLRLPHEETVDERWRGLRVGIEVEFVGER